MSDDHKWTCPDTGQGYCLKHLVPAVHQFSVKMNNDSEPVNVPVRVFFSNHCYSKTAEGNDPHHFKEQKHHGVEIRTFCPSRWEFSRRLPEIIKDIGMKRCLLGGEKSVLYRLEDSTLRNRNEGWYICMKFSFKEDKDIPVELSIRSVHYRTNPPHGIRRGPPKPFRILLRRFLEGQM